MGGKSGGLTPEQWAEVRAAYEGGEAIGALSRRFGVARNTLKKHRDDEGWVLTDRAIDRAVSTVSSGEDLVNVAATAAKSKVIDMASRRAVEIAEASGAVDEASQYIADELVATGKAGKLAAEYMLKFLEKAKNGDIKPAPIPGMQNEADVAKSVMAAYKTFQSTVRENHGLRTGTPSVPKDNSADKVEEIRFTIVGKPTGTEG